MLAIRCGVGFACRVDEIGERIRQAELRGPDGGLGRGAQQPGLGTFEVHRRDLAEGAGGVLALCEVAEEFVKLLVKIVGQRLAAVALQRVSHGRARAGSAAQAEVDAPWKQAAQHAEGLGDFERAVVRQHDAAGADPDSRGRRRYRSDHDFGAGAGQAGSAMMLR